MISITHVLILAAGLFCMGLFGVMTSRNSLRVIICIELMLNAVNLNLVAFSSRASGQPEAALVFVILITVVAAAEVGLALALVIALSRSGDVGAIDSYAEMKG